MATVWCFQCGLDYVDEVAACVECGVGTVEYRPTPPHLVGGDDDPQMAYELHAWSLEARGHAEAALEGAGLAHGWDGPTLIVLAPDAEAVDEILAGIDSGEDDEGGEGLDGVDLDAMYAERTEPEGPGAYKVIESLFLAADTLARHPRDVRAHVEVREWSEVAGEMSVPFGFEPAAWRSIQTGAGQLAELVEANNDDEAIETAAGGLAKILRSYV